MSLEQTLEQTNELLKQVIVMLQTAIAAQAEFGAPETKTTRTRKAKTEEAAAPAQAPTPAPAPAPAPARVATNAQESIFWLIEKHNTVYEQKPGDSTPGIEGAQMVTKEVYEAKKAEFAALVKTAAVAQNQTAPAPTQPTAGVVVDAAPEKTASASSHTAASAEAAPQASTAAEVPFQSVVDVMTAINKSDKPEHGRVGLLSILKKWLPKDDKPSVTKLAALGKNAEIVAEAQALLNGTPAAAAEDFDPLA